MNEELKKKLTDIREKLNTAIDFDEYDSMRELTLEALLELEAILGVTPDE